MAHRAFISHMSILRHAQTIFKSPGCKHVPSCVMRPEQGGFGPPSDHCPSECCISECHQLPQQTTDTIVPLECHELTSETRRCFIRSLFFHSTDKTGHSRRGCLISTGNKCVSATKGESSAWMSKGDIALNLKY